ncbi:RDD family protein [Bacillus sp. JJ1566]|uniref:RDD family protein n=1 Tax=Bacillus sp. JJ1566 TaxID=3122961 RepID=UPI002FFFBA92
MQCSKCNHQEKDGVKFCTNCGEKLEAPKEIKPVLNFCPGCGTKREHDTNFCMNCGFNFSEQKGAPQETAATVQSSTSQSFNTYIQPEQKAYTQTPGVLYASFGRRAAASLLDGVFSFVFIVIFTLLFLSNSYDVEGKMRFWGFIFGLGYKAGMESSRSQGTLGKMIMGIKVADADGNRISFLRALGRFFAGYLSALIIGIGYLMAAFTSKRQTLHDMIASTIVIKK